MPYWALSAGGSRLGGALSGLVLAGTARGSAGSAAAPSPTRTARASVPAPPLRSPLPAPQLLLFQVLYGPGRPRPDRPHIELDYPVNGAIPAKFMTRS
ncbi:hypothetical protein ACGFX8_20500 [Streptomyces sp. NPDC048362]|uniref:hypothetical protein n=1 Tax=Streptomyces sp. NPDC048362 TaxID=3365539 RepID=UPI003722258C